MSFPHYAEYWIAAASRPSAILLLQGPQTSYGQSYLVTYSRWRKEPSHRRLQKI